MVSPCAGSGARRKGRGLRTVVAAVLVGLLLAGGAVWWLSRSTNAQAPVVARLWPAFTMTYTVQMRDLQTGRLTADQTRQLVVTSEYAWREQVTRDGIKPK